MQPVAGREMWITVEPVTEVVRCYEAPPSPTRDRPHCAVMLVTWSFPSVAVVSAASGSVRTRHLRELARVLHGRGCATLEAWRRRGHLLPWGQVVERGKTYDKWAIDLATHIDVIDPRKGP